MSRKEQLQLQLSFSVPCRCNVRELSQYTRATHTIINANCRFGGTRAAPALTSAACVPVLC